MKTTTPQTIAILAFAPISLLLSGACLVFSLRASSTRAFYQPLRWMMFWVALSALNEATNASMWAVTDDVGGYAWFCDISIRVRMAASIGVPAAAFATAFKVARMTLATLSDDKKASVDEKDSRRNLLDNLVCIVPVLPYILLQLATTIPNRRRFTVLESVGCVHSPLPGQANDAIGVAPVLLFDVAAFLFGLGTLVAHVVCRDTLHIPKRRHRWFFRRLCALSMVVAVLSFASTFLVWTTAPSLDARSRSHMFADMIAQLKYDAWVGNTTLAAAVEFARWAQAGGPAIALVLFLFLAVDPRAASCMRKLAEHPSLPNWLRREPRERLPTLRQRIKNNQVEIIVLDDFYGGTRFNESVTSFGSEYAEPAWGLRTTYMAPPPPPPRRVSSTDKLASIPEEPLPVYVAAPSLKKFGRAPGRTITKLPVSGSKFSEAF